MTTKVGSEQTSKAYQYLTAAEQEGRTFTAADLAEKVVGK